VPAWLAEHGVVIGEAVVESGLMYLTRWYHRRAAPLPEDPKLGGDLGFVKYLAVPGDGDTLSVTLAVRTGDRELRSALADPDRFEHACRILPGPDLFFGDGQVMDPIGGVRPMTGLVNRLRCFRDERGRPRVLGFAAVGDAHTCTNPLYGRGCALAVVMAVLLADAATAHPGDPAALACAYEAACAREVEPWYHSSVQMDALGADPAGFVGRNSDGELNPAAKAMAAVFAAAATEPVIGRGISRLMNLLVTPAELFAEPAFMARVGEIMADPDQVDIPPRCGPTRRELLDALADVPTSPRNPDPDPEPAGAPT
jgi:hypothetical protein